MRVAGQVQVLPLFNDIVVAVMSSWRHRRHNDAVTDGGVLRIGELRMRVDWRDQRCVVVTIDPVTLHRDPVILSAIARERGTRLGVYGSTVRPGRVAPGDPVELET